MGPRIISHTGSANWYAGRSCPAGEAGDVMVNEDDETYGAGFMQGPARPLGKIETYMDPEERNG